MSVLKGYPASQRGARSWVYDENGGCIGADCTWEMRPWTFGVYRDEAKGGFVARVAVRDGLFVNVIQFPLAFATRKEAACHCRGFLQGRTQAWEGHRVEVGRVTGAEAAADPYCDDTEDFHRAARRLCQVGREADGTMFFTTPDAGRWGALGMVPGRRVAWQDIRDDLLKLGRILSRRPKQD